MPFRLLTKHPEIENNPRAIDLIPILTGNTDISSGGFPYLDSKSFQSFRDTIPHILGQGQKTLDAALLVAKVAQELVPSDELDSFRRALKVVRTMLNTAAVTAPSDLWLLRIVLSSLDELGLLEALLSGEQINPEQCQLDSHELKTNLSFLHARGYVELRGERYEVASSHRSRQVLQSITPLCSVPGQATEYASQLFHGDSIKQSEADTLRNTWAMPSDLIADQSTGWVACWYSIELGWRILPIVLGLRSAGLTFSFVENHVIPPEQVNKHHPELVEMAFHMLALGGVLMQRNGAWELTTIGRRVMSRGPGPFGIIQAYFPYMARLTDTLKKGRSEVWVTRGANVAASQDANRQTFTRANDALDAFCERTGFKYTVFIEHAMGRGEAIRQRYARSVDQPLIYFGADLEDASIDAAIAERESGGSLPPNVDFIRNADIGRPEVVINHLRRKGVSTRGAVMMVGNGFHEVRHQTFEKMVQIFGVYQNAGIVLMFTEASALSVADLLETGWNTYHAGFKYVHDKSGQGLRPAEPVPSGNKGKLRASWTECAESAGYVRLDTYQRRSRTIFPFRTQNQYNPSISVNHFFVPAKLAERLKINPN